VFEAKLNILELMITGTFICGLECEFEVKKVVQVPFSDLRICFELVSIQLVRFQHKYT